MGVFRPTARVTDPGGHTWEVYATRLVLPASGSRGRGARRSRRRALAVPRLLFALFVGLPAAGVRALRSDTWTIEAIAWMPQKTTYAWRTTTEYRGHVLAQVEGQLARGEIPHPGHARFLGVR